MSLVKFLYFVLIISFIVSCNQINDTIKSLSNEKIIESEIVQDSVIDHVVSPLYITNVDQLRLRNYPDTKSEILTTLDENSIIFYLNEQTDYTESIGKHSAPWLKVKTSQDHIVGWVYGASFFVESFLSKLQIDSIHNLAKEIQIFEHKGKREMNELTGANWGKAIPGTRFSGYYTFDKEASQNVPNGKVIIRARIFDAEKKEVIFLPCSLIVENGMPMSEVNCIQKNEG